MTSLDSSLHRTPPEPDAVPVRHRPGLVVVAAAVTALAGAGCVHYQPRPISASDTATTLAARSFADPGLSAFLAENDEPVPARGSAWNLRALTLAAFYFQPALDVARAEVAAAQAGTVSAGARQNPALGASAGFNSSTPVHSISPWILDFNLDIPFTTAGKRRHQIAEATKLAEVARFKLAAVAWSVRSQVRSAALELYAALGRQALLVKQVGILQANAELLDARLAAGEISAFEATQGHLALTTARMARAEAGARVEAARGQLAQALGVPAVALTEIRVGFDEFQKPTAEIPSAQARRAALLNRADILASLAEYDASEQALALEVARQYPEVHLGPGYEFDQGDSKWLLGVALPIPVMNRNRGPIAEAEARREAIGAQFVAVQAAAMAEIDQAVAGCEAAQRTLSVSEAIDADLGRQEQAASARFEAGEISRLELGSIHLEAVDAEMSRLDAEVRAQVALGRLEDAMQTSSQAVAAMVGHAPRERDQRPGEPRR
ncbi:MAG: TolC family protein [Acidobacteriota bacterium]